MTKTLKAMTDTRMFCVGGYSSAFTFQSDFRIETDRKQNFQRKSKLVPLIRHGMKQKPGLGQWPHDDSNDILSKIQDFTVAWGVETTQASARVEKDPNSQSTGNRLAHSVTKRLGHKPALLSNQKKEKRFLKWISLFHSTGFFLSLTNLILGGESMAPFGHCIETQNYANKGLGNTIRLGLCLLKGRLRGLFSG